MALAPLVAEAIAECLGSTRMIRGRPLYHKAWNGLWPIEKRHTREFCSFGMETLLKLDLMGTRDSFEPSLIWNLIIGTVSSPRVSLSP